MVGSVREATLIAMERDFDHFVNRRSLCVEAISMSATRRSGKRLTKRRYRAPRSDYREDIAWDDAFARVAEKIRKTRDATWIASVRVGDKAAPVNRTDAIGLVGAARNANEECDNFQKAAPLLGLSKVERPARL
jgi:formate dehydrogenase major subunit